MIEISEDFLISLCCSTTIRFMLFCQTIVWSLAGILVHNCFAFFKQMGLYKCINLERIDGIENIFKMLPQNIYGSVE